MSQQRNPQTGAAIALAQLLQENPTLPPLDWHISHDGHLRASIVDDTLDVRAVMAPFAAAFGETASEFQYVSMATGTARYSTTLSGMWRDIPFFLQMVCSAAALATQGSQAVAA